MSKDLLPHDKYATTHKDMGKGFTHHVDSFDNPNLSSVCGCRKPTTPLVTKELDKLVAKIADGQYDIEASLKTAISKLLDKQDIKSRKDELEQLAKKQPDPETDKRYKEGFMQMRSKVKFRLASLSQSPKEGK